MNRVVGAVLILAALVVASVPGSPAQAATSSSSVQMGCGFSDPPTGTPWPTTVDITHPDSVNPGESFQVTVDVTPMVNGPIASEAGAFTMRARMAIAGNSPDAGTVLSNGWENDVAIGSGASYQIPPLATSITAGDSGSIEVTFDEMQLQIYLLPDSTLHCRVFQGGAPSSITVAIPISETTTTTEGPPGETTTTTEGSGGTTTTTEGSTTTSSSTTTPSTTTTTVPESTTTTVPPTTTSTTIAKADTISASKSVSYACTPVVSGSTLGTETATQTVTISAPDRVNTGDEFSVAMKMSPGPANGPIPLDPGNVDPTGTVKVTGGSPSTLKVYGSTNSSVIAARGTITVPTMRGTVKATGSVGDTISYAPGTFTFNSPLLNAVTTCEPSSTVQVLSTQIVAEQIDVAAGQSSLPSTGIEEPATKAWVSALLLYAGFLFITALPRGWRLPGAKGDAS